jgi:hypothetical protein
LQCSCMARTLLRAAKNSGPTRPPCSTAACDHATEQHRQVQQIVDCDGEHCAEGAKNSSGAHTFEDTDSVRPVRHPRTQTHTRTLQHSSLLQ